MRKSVTIFWNKITFIIHDIDFQTVGACRDCETTGISMHEIMYNIITKDITMTS